MVIDLMLAVMSSRRIGDAASSALLGGHHVDIARYKGHLLAPAFGALQFQRFMLGDGLPAFKLLPAFLATILVGRHGLKPSK
jgi:hypothetical protein